MSQFAISRPISIVIFALAVVVAPPGAARAADEDRVAELERRIDDSARLIEELTRRIRELEARLSPEPARVVVASNDDSMQRLDSVEEEIRQIVEAEASRSATAGLDIHGFADVGAGTRNPTTPELEGFTVGTLGFYLTPDLGERTRALIELVFEVDSFGDLATDLERAQVGYEIGEGSTIWVGRFHTPYGYYNTAFHHGQQISTSLRRPRFLQFEDLGGIFPAHTVGAWWNGSRRLDASKLSYDLFVGNAQRISDGTLDLGAAGVPGGDALVGGNIGFLPGGKLEGLKVGASFFTASVEDDAIASNRTRVNNYGLYAVYLSDHWENLLELYFLDNKDLSDATGRHRSDAGFVQVAYRLDNLMPYLRYERAALDQADSFFSAQASGGSYDRSALGLRFDLDLATTLKFEVARTNFTDRLRDEFSEALMQYAIRF